MRLGETSSGEGVYSAYNTWCIIIDNEEKEEYTNIDIDIDNN
jgi:hypothetical protein